MKKGIATKFCACCLAVNCNSDSLGQHSDEVLGFNNNVTTKATQPWYITMIINCKHKLMLEWTFHALRESDIHQKRLKQINNDGRIRFWSLLNWSVYISFATPASSAPRLRSALSLTHSLTHAHTPPTPWSLSSLWADSYNKGAGRSRV